MLTLSTIALESRTDLPKVHYATALDWFIICSFGYCIATLLEFAGVHYFTKVLNFANNSSAWTILNSTHCFKICNLFWFEFFKTFLCRIFNQKLNLNLIYDLKNGMLCSKFDFTFASVHTVIFFPSFFRFISKVFEKSVKYFGTKKCSSHTFASLTWFNILAP